jgi:hypothetical protein
MRTWILVAVVLIAACKKEEAAAPAKPKEPKKEEVKKPPEPSKPAAPDPALVERGGYLATMMGCPFCHTAVGPQGPDMANAFAGGLEVQEAFGTWRSPNITQDKKTGIGDWTDEQILAAVREGKRPNGDGLFPIMPYLYYNNLSTEDGKALVAFLRTLPAIEKAVPGNTELKLPKVPAPPPPGTEPNRDDPVKYGEYLVGLLHCHMCHTPFDEKTMSPDMAKSFAGGFKMDIPKNFEPMMGTGTMITPNITSDEKTGIGKWTEEQLVALITKGMRPDGTPVGGVMGLYVMAGWSKMKPEDALAIAKFVKTIPAVSNKVPKGTFKPPANPPGPPPGHGGGPPPPK